MTDIKSPPMADQPRADKILIWVFVALIILAVLVTFWRIVMARDYIIQNEIDCDPYAEKCFIWECDPEATDEWEACTGDPEADIWYYKIARRNASLIPECDPETDETCLPFECLPGEPECEQILCEEGNEDEIPCVDPVQYALDNPMEEEEAECEEGEEGEECEDVEACDPETDPECVPSEEGTEDAGEKEGEEAAAEEDESEETADEGSVAESENPEAELAE